MNSQIPRWRYSLKLSSIHLSISLAVAIAVASIVYFLLYPAPYHALLGVNAIFLLLIGADATCGPLLTAILANPNKSRKETGIDLSLVVLIQLSALLYGLFAVYVARPVALVFEEDRFVVITANEILPHFQDDALPEYQNIPLIGIKEVEIRAPKNNDEYVTSLDLSLGGATPSMRPNWWQPYNKNNGSVNSRAKTISLLLSKYPDSQKILESIAQRSGKNFETLRFIPFVSSRNLEWVAILDSDNNIIGHAPFDGFPSSLKP